MSEINNNEIDDIDIISIVKSIFKNYIMIGLISFIFFVFGIIFILNFQFSKQVELKLSINTDTQLFENYNALLASIATGKEVKEGFDLLNLDSLDSSFLVTYELLNDLVGQELSQKKSIKSNLNKNLSFLSDNSNDINFSLDEIIESLNFESLIDQNLFIVYFESTQDFENDLLIKKNIIESINLFVVNSIIDEINFLKSIIDYRYETEIAKNEIILSSSINLYNESLLLELQKLKDALVIAKSLNIEKFDPEEMQSNNVKIYLQEIPVYLRGYKNLEEEINSLLERKSDPQRYDLDVLIARNELETLKDYKSLILQNVENSVSYDLIKKTNFLEPFKERSVKYVSKISKITTLFGITFVGFVISIIFFIFRDLYFSSSNKN